MENATTLVFLSVSATLVSYYLLIPRIKTFIIILVSYEPVHEISNNVVCATSKASDQPAHTRSLIRAFVSRLSILWLLSYWLTPFGVSNLNRWLQRLIRVYTLQNATLLEISCTDSYHITEKTTNTSNIYTFVHIAYLYIWAGQYL